MRAVYAILLCAVFCPFLSARADVITNTSASIRVGEGVSCLSSGPTQSNCDLGSGSAGANAHAYADQFDAWVSAQVYGFPTISGPGVFATAEAQIDGKYVLYGDTGTGSFDIYYTPFSDQGGDLSCSVEIAGGSAQSCKSPVIVEYGVPFTMDVTLTASAFSAPFGEGVLGEAVVDFSQQGLSATPEPSSILLLMPGVAGVFAAGLRAKRKMMQPFAD